MLEELRWLPGACWTDERVAAKGPLSPASFLKDQADTQELGKNGRVARSGVRRGYRYLRGFDPRSPGGVGL